MRAEHNTTDRLLWPHQSENLFRSETQGPADWIVFHTKYAATNFRFNMRGLGSRFGVARPPHVLEGGNAYEAMINGPNHASLWDKPTFGPIVESIGYKTPHQVMVHKRDPLEHSLEKVRQEFPDYDEPLLLKPARIGAYQGRGIMLAQDELQLQAHLKDIPVNYLVQEYLPAERDFRYVLIRGKEGLWRICYEKRKPQVTGTGDSRLLTLILTDKEMPTDSKRKIIKKMLYHQEERDSLLRVPNSNDIVKLVKTGNISAGAYGVLPTEDEMQAIDPFMVGFINDLEDHLGTSLASLCFDFGLTEGDLSGMSPDELKQKLVFYEYNQPLLIGIEGYLQAINTNFLERKRVRKQVSSAIKSNRKK